MIDKGKNKMNMLEEKAKFLVRLSIELRKGKVKGFYVINGQLISKH